MSEGENPVLLGAGTWVQPGPATLVVRAAGWIVLVPGTRKEVVEAAWTVLGDKPDPETLLADIAAAAELESDAKIPAILFGITAEDGTAVGVKGKTLLAAYTQEGSAQVAGDDGVLETRTVTGLRRIAFGDLPPEDPVGGLRLEAGIARIRGFVHVPVDPADLSEEERAALAEQVEADGRSIESEEAKKRRAEKAAAPAPAAPSAPRTSTPSRPSTPARRPATATRASGQMPSAGASSSTPAASSEPAAPSVFDDLFSSGSGSATTGGKPAAAQTPSSPEASAPAAPAGETRQAAAAPAPGGADTASTDAPTTPAAESEQAQASAPAETPAQEPVADRPDAEQGAATAATPERTDAVGPSSTETTTAAHAAQPPAAAAGDGAAASPSPRPPSASRRLVSTSLFDRRPRRSAAPAPTDASPASDSPAPARPAAPATPAADAAPAAAAPATPSTPAEDAQVPTPAPSEPVDIAARAEDDPQATLIERVDDADPAGAAGVPEQTQEAPPEASGAAAPAPEAQPVQPAPTAPSPAVDSPAVDSPSDALPEPSSPVGAPPAAGESAGSGAAASTAPAAAAVPPPTGGGQGEGVAESSGAYDDLFGHTIFRSVEDAAVRTSAEEEHEDDGHGTGQPDPAEGSTAADADAAPSGAGSSTAGEGDPSQSAASSAPQGRAAGLPLPAQPPPPTADEASATIGGDFIDWVPGVGRTAPEISQTAARRAAQPPEPAPAYPQVHMPADRVPDVPSSSRPGASTPGTPVSSSSAPTPAPHVAPGAVMLAGLVCPVGHPNPPELTQCRQCGLPLAGTVRSVLRPPLGSVRISTGGMVLLDRTAIFGRRPRASRVSGNDVPQLITVPSPQQDISRSHLELRLEGWRILAVDLGTTNGTTVHRPGAEPLRLRPQEGVAVQIGDQIDLGDGVVLRVEAGA